MPDLYSQLSQLGQTAGSIETPGYLAQIEGLKTKSALDTAEMQRQAMLQEQQVRDLQIKEANQTLQQKEWDAPFDALSKALTIAKQNRIPKSAMIAEVSKKYPQWQGLEEQQIKDIGNSTYIDNLDGTVTVAGQDENGKIVRRQFDANNPLLKDINNKIRIKKDNKEYDVNLAVPPSQAGEQPIYTNYVEVQPKNAPVSQYSEAQKRYLQDIGIDITNPENKTIITNIISSESGKAGIKSFEDKIQADKLALVNARGESFSKAKAKYTTQSYYDTELKKPKVLSDATFERLNEEEPDRYIKMQDLKTADPLIVRQGRVSEIKNSINNFNKTLEAMPEFTPQQASHMGVILNEMESDKDKGIISGAIDDFLRTDIGQSLTDEQKQYVYNLNNLRESAMALQTLQTGSSRSSDYMRKLISNMLPNAKTPDKKSARLQMDLFTQEFNKLTENLSTISIGKESPKEKPKEKTLIRQLKNKTTGKILNIYSDGSKEYAK